MPTIDINDTTLYYERTGQGPAMLFVHGMCGDAEVWADQARPLLGPLHVRALRPPRPQPQPRGDAADQRRVARRRRRRPHRSAGLAPCLLVGSSGGAAIAVDVALRYGHLLRGAVFSEPPLFSLDPRRRSGDHG